MVSVIVPVYNTRRYLQACVESILNQSYADLELILVDDGSTDGSGELCDSMAADSRIVVIHRANGGASTARNAGIEVARGEWIAFIDSDDTVHQRYIESLVDLQERYDADIASVFVAGRHKSEEAFYTPQQAMESMLYQTGSFDSSPCKLFAASTVKDCRFDESYRVYEDMEWLSRLLPKTRRIACCGLSLYFYDKRLNGTLNSHSPRCNDAFRVMDCIDQRLVAIWDGSLVKAANSRRLSLCFNILRLLSVSNVVDLDMETLCMEQIKALRVRCFFDPHVRLKNKAGIVLSLFGKSFLKLCFRRFQ